MATFNWSNNPYFTTTAYVGPVGIDSQDGSANTPYRTLQKCKDASKTAVQLAPGVYREVPAFSNVSIYLEPGAVIDGFLQGTSHVSASIYGGKIKNASLSTSSGANIFVNCFLSKCLSYKMSVSAQSYGNIFKDMASSLTGWESLGYSVIRNNTLINCLIQIYAYPMHGTSSANGWYYNIFKDCKIKIASALNLLSINGDYNIYNNCTYSFGADTSYYTLAQLEVTYGVSGIAAIRAYYNAKFGTSAVFLNSSISDPLFNNASTDDYTLQPLSPARHMAYDGTFIGAKDVGFPTYAYANDLGYPNAFYNASKHANVLVANNSITLARNADGSAVGSGYITEKPKNLGQIYELKGNQSSFIGADRNREMLDANSDIGEMASPVSAGTALTSGVIYINEGGSVIYNSVTYPNRSRITAVDSVQSFTTTEGAVLHVVTEYPNRYTNLIRHKQTIVGTQIAAGTNLTADSWYRVYNNSITWDGKVVPVGDSFQAVAGKLSFSGSGVCVEEFNSADVWHECIIDAPIKCRRVGNVASGAIDVGTDGKPLTNGHREYYNATNKSRAEFSIYAAYIQKHWVLNAKMSK